MSEHLNGRAIADGLVSAPADFDETMRQVAASIADVLPGVHFTLFFYRPPVAGDPPEGKVISTIPQAARNGKIREWLHMQQFGKRDEIIDALRQTITQLEMNHQRIVAEVWRDSWRRARASAGIIPLLADRGADEAWVQYVDENEKAAKVPNAQG